MPAFDKMFAVKLTENDVPGVNFAQEVFQSIQFLNCKDGYNTGDKNLQETNQHWLSGKHSLFIY